MLNNLLQAIDRTLTNAAGALQPQPVFAGALMSNGSAGDLSQDRHQLEDVLALADELRERPRVFGACADPA